MSWVQLIKREEYGRCCYVVHGTGDSGPKRGLEFEEAATIKVRFPDGTITDAMLASHEHTEDFSEPGRSNVVTWEFWGVVTMVNGCVMWFDLTDVEVHEDSLERTTKLSWDMDRKEYDEWVTEGAWDRIWDAYEHVRQERDAAHDKLDEMAKALAKWIQSTYETEPGKR